jgi:hypothetical protein
VEAKKRRRERRNKQRNEERKNSAQVRNSIAKKIRVGIIFTQKKIEAKTFTAATK